MGVKLRKKNGKWYVFIDWHGRRKAKCLGTSRQVAEEVKRKIEAKLALGEFNMTPDKKAPSFEDYSERWLKTHVRPHLKPSTIESYQSILECRLRPRFGSVAVDRITRDAVKDYLAELVAGDELSRNTVRNILATFRAMLGQAVEDGLIPANPVQRLGRQTRGARDPRRVEFLTASEVESFLRAAEGLRPERYPLFLAAVRAGLRQGELIALEWDDIQFGESEEDSNRYTLVRHNFTCGQFTTPKSHKPRRVDLNWELRQALVELRDRRMLEAFGRGEEKIPALVFPSQTGGPLDSRNVYHRDFLPCLKAAGLRRVTFHALRHTFASLLIQAGASLAYVKEQLGHSSIQVTVDTYGHLLPGGNIRYVDSLTSRRQNATLAQPAVGGKIKDSLQVVEKSGRPGGIRTPDPRFRKPFHPILLTRGMDDGKPCNPFRLMSLCYCAEFI